ncbi:MAG: hypothetical protein HOV97_44925 [Nonomuraea sp.]|nr:hypothetical protein [Nonomuraea sp.]
MLAVPALAAGLVYGAEGPLDVHVVRAGVAILIGVLAGSRISPLASLLPGLAFTAYAGVLMVRGGVGDLIPAGYLEPLNTWSSVIGVILLAASVFPSRWRARKGKEAAPESEREEPPPLPKRVPFASEKITSARPAAGPATGR